MTGIKGRSGKVTTPESRRLRQLAAQQGGLAKAGHPPADDKPDPPGDEDQKPDGLIALLPGKNPYDRAVLRSKGQFSYLDAKTREQSNGELLANEKRTIDIRTTLKDLIPKEEVQASNDRRRELILSRLQEIPEALVKFIPLEQQAAYRHAAGKAIADFRTSVADQLKGM